VDSRSDHRWQARNHRSRSTSRDSSARLHEIEEKAHDFSPVSYPQVHWVPNRRFRPCRTQSILRISRWGVIRAVISAVGGCWMW